MYINSFVSLFIVYLFTGLGTKYFLFTPHGSERCKCSLDTTGKMTWKNSAFERIPWKVVQCPSRIIGAQATIDWVVSSCSSVPCPFVLCLIISLPLCGPPTDSCLLFLPVYFINFGWFVLIVIFLSSFLLNALEYVICGLFEFWMKIGFNLIIKFDSWRFGDLVLRYGVFLGGCCGFAHFVWPSTVVTCLQILFERERDCGE